MPNSVAQFFRGTIIGPAFSISRAATSHQLQTRHLTYRLVHTDSVSSFQPSLASTSSSRARFIIRGDPLAFHRFYFTTMPARKRKSDQLAPSADVVPAIEEASSTRRSSRRKSQKATYKDDANGDEVEGLAVADGQDSAVLATAVKTEEVYEPEVVNVPVRRQAKRQKVKVEQITVEGDLKGNVISPSKTAATPVKGRKKKSALPTPEKEDSGHALDDDYVQGADEPEVAEEVVAERGAKRPPAVNSSYLPLPWKGRLGYACLNTYLRAAKPPVFSSRTCRMASIIEHRHPLQDPSLPEHAIKNRPDKTQEPDIARGDKFVQELGLANARDIIKMIRWNDKYGIKFMRLSSEMFPFASHPEHGYSLAPFASETLAEAGKVAAELGHRLTTHPGQFTQLGSPRKEVIDSSIRDLVYHDELLSLLKLPEQQNRDAVMIIHMGGVYGDKEASLARFRTNYARLRESVKARLVLENDDVSWSVHDLLPVCEELNIPLVLDWHHHNIVFDPTQLREGTLDISQPVLMDRILATWRRKNITPKMHYSEPCPGALTPRDRRKHSPRVWTLPPCPPDMDLMIEAKDKEQAVFELMRTFKLPGFEKISDIIPHEREDEDRPPARVPKVKAASRKKKKKTTEEDAMDVEEEVVKVEEVDMGRIVSPEEFGMGGPENRVYWPLGMEEWLKPKKRDVKKKGTVVKDDDEAENEVEA